MGKRYRQFIKKLKNEYIKMHSQLNKDIKAFSNLKQKEYENFDFFHLTTSK